MKRKPSTPLFDLLTLLRRIIVLSVAAYGLIRELPYGALAIRLVVLWGVLYVSAGVLEFFLRRMAYRALTQTADGGAPEASPLSVPSAEARR